MSETGLYILSVRLERGNVTLRWRKQNLLAEAKPLTGMLAPQARGLWLSRAATQIQ
jgi:hypothetical protein